MRTVRRTSASGWTENKTERTTNRHCCRLRVQRGSQSLWRVHFLVSRWSSPRPRGEANQSWMLVAAKDRTINPDLERWYATRAHSHMVEVAGASHSVYVSHPRKHVRSRNSSDSARSLHPGLQKWGLYLDEDAFRQLSSPPVINFKATCREQQEQGTQGEQ